MPDMQALRPFSRDPLLTERESTHGSFAINSVVSQGLKAILRDQPGWAALSDRQREAVDMICGKLGRIMAGNPNLQDHWRDISGYATLGCESCK